MLAPMWVKFTDKDKEVSTKLFYGIWVYDTSILFACYVFIMLTVRGPFIMVSTVCICKELDCLVGAIFKNVHFDPSFGFEQMLIFVKLFHLSTDNIHFDAVSFRS